MQRAAAIEESAAAIELRGGHVVFVVLPTSGLITEMEAKQFPRKKFWDRFAGLTHSRTLHFVDVPMMKKCPVPDGSHIDYRNRGPLTVALLDALGMDIDTPAHHPLKRDVANHTTSCYFHPDVIG